MKIKTALIALSALAATATADASAFFAWEGTGVSRGDVLNIRKYPSTHSRIQSAYPNGTVLSLTGRCKYGVILEEVAGHLPAEQLAAVRHTWCEVWHDPAKSGEHVRGWVYMKYMKPH